MIVFSTVLQVEGLPIIYSVYKNRALAFLSPVEQRNAPILFATLSEKSWEVRGTQDDDLMKQALREIASV